MMSTTKVFSSATIATAAALLFNLGAIPVASAEEAKAHCSGANACKGQSACKSAHNACKGQNSCKGQGFLELTKQECDAAKSKS
jgi:hypothetical protein